MLHRLKTLLLAAAVCGAAGAHAGITLNGLGLNALSMNGLSINGLDLNRLAFNGVGPDAPAALNGISLEAVGVR
jgi:hypothetical protein